MNLSIYSKTQKKDTELQRGIRSKRKENKIEILMDEWIIDILRERDKERDTE